MMPQNLDWGFLAGNISKVALDVKSKIDAENRQKWILIAAGAVGAAIFVLLFSSKGR
jgi:hypothetical protein